MHPSRLLEAAAGGDRAAWAAIVDRYSRLVWATVRGHRLGDADAADVVQTTWLRLVEHLGRIDDPDRLGAWLVTTARRESLRVLAAAARTVPTDDPEPAASAGALVGGTGTGEGVEGRLLSGERDAALRAALGAISASCQRLLRVLAAEPAPAYEEVSAALDMPIGSIGPTRRRCMERLRAELEVRGITGAA